jgi:hypothetical protein
MLVSFLALCCGSCPPASATVPGDVDGDTQVTLNDVRLAVSISGGLFKAMASNVAAGDVASATGNTPDGRITILDAARILRAINGLDNLGGSASGSKALPLNDPSVAIPSNLVRNYTLPGGFTLSGTAKTTAGLSITNQAGLPMTTGSLSFVNGGSPSSSGAASVAGTTGNYSTVLAAGTYNVKVMSQVINFDIQTGAFSNYTLQQTATPSTVSISADKTQNFVRPDLPVTGMVAGAVAGADVVPQSVDFTLSAGVGSGSGVVDVGAYTVTAPPGAGYLSVHNDYAADSNVSVAAYLFASPLTVVSGSTLTRDITIPALGTIHGTVTPPSGTSIDSVFAGNYVVGQSAATDQYTSTYLIQTATPNAYRLALPPGTYPLTVVLAPIATSTSSMSVYFITQAVFTLVDTVKDFTVPALASTVVFSGVVKGPGGAVLSGANVTLMTHTTSTPTSGFFVVAQGKTNASGAFNISVLPGTYDVMVSP